MKTLEIFEISWRRLLPALLLGTVLTSANCSALNDDDNSDDETLTLLSAAFLSSCNLGTQSFTAGGSLSCALNNAAGTGTLTAASTATSFVSMQVSFQLLASDSSLSLVAGLNPALGVATSNTGGVGELQVTPTVTKKPADGGAGAAGAGTTAQTWCFEIHVDENPMHAILDQTTCTAKAATAVTYEDDANGGAIEGGLWGFVLNNAAITGLSFNGQKIFTE